MNGGTLGKRKKLDGTLSKLTWFKMSPLIAGGLDQVTFKRSLSIKPFCDSVLILSLLGF